MLTVKPLETIVAGKMDAEQTEIFAMYAETGGLLQQFASPLDLYWYNYISSYYGYRKNPNTGNEELHRGVDIAVPTGTTVYAAHDGTVTTAAYDSYYGNYVVIEKMCIRDRAKPDTAQKTITFKKMFRDGICQVTHNFYTKMVEFYDINYDLLEVEDQGDILEEYSKLINYFDPSIKFEPVSYTHLDVYKRQV